MNTEHTNQSRQAATAAFEQWWQRHGLEDPMDDEDRYFITASSWARRGYLAAMQAQQAGPVAPAVKESLTAQPEPVALSLPFFAYDSETGFERFATEAEAKQYVQDGIDECRSNMLQGEAWPSEIEKLCWGVVLGGTKEIKLGDVGDGSGDYYSDYVLTDAAQPPAVAVAGPDGYHLVADATLRRAIVSLIDRVTGHTLSCNETAVEQLRFIKEIAAAPQASLLAPTIQLGLYGRAFDTPQTRRAYTYQHQPDNLDAYNLGRAAASTSPGGDNIDRGLSLLKELQAHGFGVFELGDQQEGGA